MRTKVGEHPAKFTDVLIEEFRRQLDLHGVTGTVLDPFAGTGRVHHVRTPDRKTLGIELEVEWCAQGLEYGPMLHGDALAFMETWQHCGMKFEAIVTSPCYGNRMSDDDPRETCKTYRSCLGRELTEGTSALMQWGDEYRAFHKRAWHLATEVLAPNGLLLLNVKDHIRRDVRQPVAAWHVRTLLELGLQLLDVAPIRTPSMANGRNGSARVDAELIVTLRQPA